MDASPSPLTRLSDTDRQGIIHRLSWMGFGFKVLALLTAFLTVEARIAVESPFAWLVGALVIFGLGRLDFMYLIDERRMRLPKSEQMQFPWRSEAYYAMFATFCILMYALE